MTSRAGASFVDGDIIGGPALAALHSAREVSSTQAPKCVSVCRAVARTVGWIAQLNEMVSDPEYKIGRPRQLFTGSVRRAVPAIEKR